MKNALRTIVYDERLRVEAYRFQGMLQPFPNHFHEYYVIGLMEAGTRALSCRNQTRTVAAGDVLLFNPGDCHGCIQSGEGALDYRCLNVSREAMLDWVEGASGRRELPRFSPNAVHDEELACCLRSLHEGILKGACGLGREEGLLLLITLLLPYGQPFAQSLPECRAEIEPACALIQERYAERINLELLCGYTGLSKSTLLRAFTKSKGVTPYRYLENIRIGEAKKLLEQGVSPVDAALLAGFSDQSHFTNAFRRCIGIPPGAYREIFLPAKTQKTN